MTETQRNLVAELWERGGSQLVATLKPCCRPVDAGLRTWRDLFLGYCKQTQIDPARRCALAISMSSELLECVESEGQGGGYPRRLNALIAWFAGCSDGLTGRGWSLLKGRSGPKELLSLIFGSTKSLPSRKVPRPKALLRSHAYRVVWRPTELLEFASGNRARYSGVVVDLASWPSNYPVSMLARLVGVGGVLVAQRKPAQDQERMSQWTAALLQWCESVQSIKHGYQWRRMKNGSKIDMLSANLYTGGEEDLGKTMRTVGEDCLLWSDGGHLRAAIAGVMRKLVAGQEVKVTNSVFGCSAMHHTQVGSKMDAWADLFRSYFSRRRYLLLLSGDEAFLKTLFEAARVADMRVFVGRLVGAPHGRVRIDAPSFVQGKPSSLDQRSEKTRINEAKTLEFLKTVKSTDGQTV